MKQMIIENFRIDISRSEVHRGTEVISLEPKVVKVLMCLAQYQGEVVSHQDLLKAAWPNTVVETNALQRCIGQLRKVFQDDAKQQRVIATFPKNGYSLVAAVEWKKEWSAAPTKVQEPSTETPKAKFLFPALGASALLIIIAFFITPASEPIEEIHLPSAELSLGLYSKYSPNGQFIIYPRSLTTQSKLRNLWVQDLSNNKEILLTEKSGFYGDAAWSPNNQNIAFIEFECSDDSCQNVQCSALKLSNISTRETTPPKAIDLLTCKDSRLLSPQWLDANSIALIDNKLNNNVVATYNLDLEHTQVIYQQAGKTPQNLAYSSVIDTLAIVLRENNSEKQVLSLLAMDTGVITQLKLSLPENIMDETWYPFWNQQNDGLILTTSMGTFNITLDGAVSEQSLPYMPSGN